MGSFDTVHRGSRCGQSKAFGKGNGNIILGDIVELVPAPMTEQEDLARLEGRLAARPERDFAVEMPEGGYVIVRHGVFAEWSDALPVGLPVFGYLGHPLEGEGVPGATAPMDDGRAEAATCS